MHPLLRRLDLNLLLVFDALYRHRNVGTAASELAISASAFSHALGRLRQGLDDELFLRQGNRMQPTQRAEHLAAAVAAALRALGEAGRVAAVRTGTEPAYLRLRRHRLHRLRPASAADEPPAAQRARSAPAPGQRGTQVVGGGPGQRRIDFALGYDEEHERLPEGIQAHDWFADRYVVVARRDHPRLAGAPTLEGYLAERHAVVTPWNDSGVIDRLLARSGLRREVAVQLPTVLAALFLAGSTDFLLTAPRHAAQALAEAAGLALYPAPFDIPPYVLRLCSHAQHVGRDAHAWMIGQLKGLDISRTG